MLRLPRAVDELRPRAFAVAALLLGAFFAWPLWAARIIPLHDLPNHLARITALHYVNDPRWNLSQFYARSLQLVPYLGHFYLVHLLTYVFRDVTLANRIFMTAYLVAAPFCGWSLARATGRSPWLALFTLPLAVCMFFQWGFISFCAGCMLLLPAMASLFRLLDAPSLRRAAFVAMWCAALYLFHVVPWASFGLFFGALAIVELAHRRWRGPLLGVAATIPSLAMMAIGFLQARRFGYIGGHKYDAEPDTPAHVLVRAVHMLNSLQGTNRDEWIAIGLMLAVVLLVVSDSPSTNEPLRVRLRLPLAFVIFGLLALATPFWIKQPFNWWMVNQRFLLPAALVGCFFPRGALRGGRALVMAGAVAAMLFIPPSLARAYRDFSARAQPMLDLINKTPLGSKTLVIHSPPGNRKFEDPMLAPELTYWREMYNYPLVLRGGYDPYLYDDGFPIKRIHSLPAPKVERAAELIWSADEQLFDADKMLGAWDYFLVADDARDDLPADGLRIVGHGGRWTLYQSLVKNSD